MRTPDRPRYHRRKRLLSGLFWLVAIGLSRPVWALDYQVHGFLSQGFILSEGNDFYGDSTAGSFEYYEAGLNGMLKLRPELSVSAQVLLRDAGPTDDGGPRLDFAFADYRFLTGELGEAGLRAGRVKNAYGLFNDTRDVVFARPGILLPLSVYFESQGARSLLFSSNGVQAYGGLSLGGHYLSLVTTYAPDHDLGSSEEERLVGSLADQGKVSMREFRSARLQDDWGNGRWTTALSYVHGRLDFQPDPGAPTDFDFDFDLYMLSGRYNGERYSLTAEYGLTAFAGSLQTFGFPTHQDFVTDGYYLQGDYFLSPRWTLSARYDAGFLDRNDRDGSACATSTGQPQDKHACYSHDLSAGINWRPDEHWGFWAEYHWIDGTYSVSQQDNANKALDPHWSMLLLMGSYRF
jgi:hypothetical protein